MGVLVSDTSVLIDLERGGILEVIFRLPVDFAVPDLLFERELKGELGDKLATLGLRVEALTSIEVGRAIEVRRSDGALSTPDAFAFAIAETRKWTLLTGDARLRKLAQDCQVETHGVLWIFDALCEAEVVLNAELHRALTAVTAHPRCRLPAAEVRKRLMRFGT